MGSESQQSAEGVVLGVASGRKAALGLVSPPSPPSCPSLRPDDVRRCRREGLLFPNVAPSVGWYLDRKNFVGRARLDVGRRRLTDKIMRFVKQVMSKHV